MNLNQSYVAYWRDKYQEEVKTSTYWMDQYDALVHDIETTEPIEPFARLNEIEEDELLALPKISVPRGGITYPSQLGLVAAGGWCAPSEQLYNICRPRTKSEQIKYWRERATKMQLENQKLHRRLKKAKKGKKK